MVHEQPSGEVLRALETASADVFAELPDVREVRVHLTVMGNATTHGFQVDGVRRSAIRGTDSDVVDALLDARSSMTRPWYDATVVLRRGEPPRLDWDDRPPPVGSTFRDWSLYLGDLELVPRPPVGVPGWMKVELAAVGAWDLLADRLTWNADEGPTGPHQTHESVGVPRPPGAEHARDPRAVWQAYRDEEDARDTMLADPPPPGSSPPPAALAGVRERWRALADRYGHVVAVLDEPVGDLAALPASVQPLARALPGVRLGAVEVSWLTGGGTGSWVLGAPSSYVPLWWTGRDGIALRLSEGLPADVLVVREVEQSATLAPGVVELWERFTALVEERLPQAVVDTAAFVADEGYEDDDEEAREYAAEVLGQWAGELVDEFALSFGPPDPTLERPDTPPVGGAAPVPWRVSEPSRQELFTEAPLLHRGMLWVARSWLGRRGAESSLTAMEPATGAVHWRRRHPGRCSRTLPAEDGVWWLGPGGRLLHVGLGGDRDPDRDVELSRGARVHDARPTSEGLLLTLSGRGGETFLVGPDGEVRWRHLAYQRDEEAQWTASYAAPGETVLLRADRGLVRWRVPVAARFWKRQEPERFLSAGPDRQGLVLVGGDHGVRLLDATTGVVRDRLDLFPEPTKVEVHAPGPGDEPVWLVVTSHPSTASGGSELLRVDVEDVGALSLRWRRHVPDRVVSEVVQGLYGDWLGVLENGRLLSIDPSGAQLADAGELSPVPGDRAHVVRAPGVLVVSQGRHLGGLVP